MALKKQTVSLPFSLGLDEKSSSETAKPGSLDLAENAVFNKEGQIEKRHGYRTKNQTISKTSGYVLDRASRIDEYNRELLVADGLSLATITETSTGAEYCSKVGTLHDIRFFKTDERSSALNNISNVKHLTYSTGSNVFVDIYAYVVGSSTASTLEVAIKDRNTGSLMQVLSLYAGASISHSASGRNNGTPSLHLVNIGSSIFAVYNVFNTTSGSSVYYQKITYSSSTDSFLVSGVYRLRTSTSANITTDADFSAMGVTTSNSQLYLAYYEHNTGSTIDSALLQKFSLSSLTGAGNADANSTALTLFTASAGTGINRDISQNTLRLSPGFLCKYHLSDPGSETVVVGLTVGTSVLKTPCSVKIFTVDPSNFAINSDDIIPDSGEGRILICGTQAPLTFDGSSYPAQIDKRKLVLTSAIPFPNTDRAFPFSRQTTGTTYFPLKTISATHGTGGGPNSSGVLAIDPLAASNNFESSAKIYYNYTNSPHTLTVTVLEGGTMFDPGAAETTNIQNQINAALGGAVFNITPGYEDLSASPVFENVCYHYKTETFDATLSGGSLTVSAAEQTFANATVLTDPYLGFPVNVYGESYSGSMPAPMYVAMNMSNGNGKTDNSYDCIMAWSPDTSFNGAWTPVAYLPTGNQSVSPALDFNNKNGSGGGRLFTAVTNLEADNVPISKDPEAGFFHLAYGTTSVVSDGYNAAKSVVDLLPKRKLPAVSAGTQMLYGGGALFSYDGVEVVENGFYDYPAVRNIYAIPNGDGAFESTGSYSYIFTYEFVDAKGNIHRSPTSPAVQLSVSTTNTVEALIYNDQISRKYAKYNLVAYRANPGSTIFRKVKTTGYTTNRYIRFQDSGGSDRTYEDSEAVYTTGGVLTDQQPGSVTDMVLHKGRLIVAAASEFVRFSKPLSQLTAPGFPAPQFIIDIPGDIQNISGVETGQNFFAIFTPDNVFAVYGEGPNAIGQGAFSQPMSIGEGQGLSLASPHLNHAFGIFYISSRGLYLITPNGQIQYVGAQVEDILSNANKILDIALFDHDNEIRVLYSNDISSEFRCCVFNTFFKQWSDWDVTSGAKPVSQIQSKTAIKDRSHVVLGLDGTISRQVERFQDQVGSTFSDITLSVILNKMHMAGLQSAQRVYRAMLLYDLDVGVGSAALQMNFAFDNDDTFTETHTISTLPSDPENVRVHLTKQKCKSIKLQIVVQHGGVTSQGAILNGIAFEVGARAGTFKLPAANTF